MKLDTLFETRRHDNAQEHLIEVSPSGRGSWWPEVPGNTALRSGDVNAAILKGGSTTAVCMALPGSEPGPRWGPVTDNFGNLLQDLARASDKTPKRSSRSLWSSCLDEHRHPAGAQALYTQLTRLVSCVMICLLIWAVAYTTLGKTAAPCGQLFGLALISISAHIGGRLASMVMLPAVTGMLLVGIAFRNLDVEVIEGSYAHAASLLRKVALVIILTRAGLDLEPSPLRRHWQSVVKLALAPWFAEAVMVAILANALLNLPWAWACMVGCVVGSVSPTVVVPCLARLRARGFGVAKGIPALIVAVASIDDAASVAVYCIISSILFSEESALHAALLGPASVSMGIAAGVAWGALSHFIPARDDPFVAPLRVLMLLFGGLAAVFASEMAGYEGAGPVAVITASFASSYIWSRQGWEIDQHPVAETFEVFMMIFEPILFGVTGMRVSFHKMESRAFYFGLILIVIGVVARVALTLLAAIGSGLNFKEKLFVAISWIAKTTVPAALGPSALDSVRLRNGDAAQLMLGEDMLSVCILSVLVTAPLGALLITLTGPRLLTRAHSSDTSNTPTVKSLKTALVGLPFSWGTPTT